MISRQLRQLLKNRPRAAPTQSLVTRQHPIRSGEEAAVRKRRTVTSDVLELLATPSGASEQVRRPHPKRNKVLDERQPARPGQFGGASGSGLSPSVDGARSAGDRSK